jgi:hypothetical protein
MRFQNEKIGARSQYRKQESLRTQESASVAEKYPELKSLTVDLTYLNSEGLGQRNEIKYTVNLVNAKTVFRFDCPNSECVCGDFDLSDDLVKAVAEHRTTVVGEARCQGWRSKATIGTVRCHKTLRYKLSLAYA